MPGPHGLSQQAPAAAARAAAVAAEQRVEVLLCSYNGERFVEAQIASILAQTRPVDLLHVHDDASTDGTVALLRRIADAHARTGGATEIRLNVRERNLGYGGNFWDAIGHSTGDVLLLCDQDDVWHPEKVARLEAALADPAVGVAFSDGDLTGPDGSRLGEGGVLAEYGLTRAAIDAFAADPLRQLLRRNCVNGAAAAVRGGLARGAPPLPAGMPHDQWLVMWCCALGHGMACLPERLYGYRQHGGNVIGIGHRRRLHRWLGLWRSAWTSRQRDRWMYDRFAQWQDTLAPTPGMQRIAAKRAWLADLVEPRRGAVALAWRIAASALAGRYRRFGTGDTLLRDVFRLAKTQ